VISLMGFATSTAGRFVKSKSSKIFDFQVGKRTEFNETIIQFAPIGYEIGYRQLGPAINHLISNAASGIISNY